MWWKWYIAVHFGAAPIFWKKVLNFCKYISFQPLLCWPGPSKGMIRILWLVPNFSGWESHLGSPLFCSKCLKAEFRECLGCSCSPMNENTMFTLSLDQRYKGNEKGWISQKCIDLRLVPTCETREKGRTWRAIPAESVLFTGHFLRTHAYVFSDHQWGFCLQTLGKTPDPHRS